jgi:hypothetical protein
MPRGWRPHQHHHSGDGPTQDGEEIEEADEVRGAGFEGQEHGRQDSLSVISHARAADVRSTFSNIKAPDTTSQYVQNIITPVTGTYTQKPMPRGRGQYIQGTYSGPSTLYYEKIDPCTVSPSLTRFMTTNIRNSLLCSE